MSIPSCPIRAFLPAAGYGERLLPITRHLPKPLLPILGRPLLEHVLRKVDACGISEIGINVHHLPGQIESWISQSPYRDRIRLFREEMLLGTGGALRNASDFLGSGHFLVHNSDIVSSLDLRRLIEKHLESRHIATLAVHRHELYNRLVLDERGCVQGLLSSGDRPGSDRLTAFTGIAVYSPAFLAYLPNGVSHVVPSWLKAVEAGQTVGTLDVTGDYWSDVGTPEAYAGTVRWALAMEGEHVYIHPRSRGCQSASLKGEVVMEDGTEIGEGVTLNNVVLLPGAKVRKGVHVSDSLVGPDYLIPIRSFKPTSQNRADIEIFASCFRGLDLDLRAMHEIGYGGSLRRYFRVPADRKTYVLSLSDPEDPDFERHIQYSRFFARQGVRVPALIRFDGNRRATVFQDLGDLSLYTWMRCPRTHCDIETVYRQVLQVMARLHGIDVPGPASNGGTVFRLFDAEYFRWESDYFLREFVVGHLGMEPIWPPGLEEELHRLAERSAACSTAIIHRDFQSQNVMLGAGREPAVIDYQGARIGPPAYDVASLLWDPYVDLPSLLREKLTDAYLDYRHDSVHSASDDFSDSLKLCRAQRHMQALGAYAFLSGTRMKKRFLKFIDPAVRMLSEDVALLRETYPALYQFVEEIRSGL